MPTYTRALGNSLANLNKCNFALLISVYAYTRYT